MDYHPLLSLIISQCNKSSLISVLFFPIRLVHAITPLEENKSFLEKVKLGEKLCGISSSESLLSTSSWGSTTGTTEISTKKSAENLHQQNQICKITIRNLGFIFSKMLITRHFTFLCKLEKD